jgi:hypothetical protein
MEQEHASSVVKPVRMDRLFEIERGINGRETCSLASPSIRPRDSMS